jgi:hypothetical protein
VTPAAATHYVGGEYDWTAIAKDYNQLKEFWAADKKDVKDAIAKKGTIDILLDVSGYELKNEVITLPDFWQTGATNGKVVNITFQGNFKNADFERAHAIDKADVVANMSKFPVRIDANNLKGAEVNFTFDVEKFDLYIATNEARSTFAGDYTIGYMFANADTGKDALEVKEGTIEGIDVTSTGEFKGTIDGVWTRDGSNISVDADGIQLANQSVKAKNVFFEKNVATSITTEYKANGKWNNYALGTIKFVNKKAESFAFMNNNVNPSVEKIQGFDKSKCKVELNGLKQLENIGAIEKVTIDTYMFGNTILAKDVFTDVTFDCDVTFSTKDVDTFENVTFKNLEIVIPEDGKDVTFNGCNFWNTVAMTSGITVTETAKTTTYKYQWIIDNTTTGAGHFEEVTAAKPLLEANKNKEVKKYSWDAIIYDNVPGSATYQMFVKNDPATANSVVNEANSSFVVEITRTWTTGSTYIPENVTIILDDKCKFSDGNITGTGATLATTNQALNYVWGNNELWDEECWYNVNYAGVEYIWKKITDTTGTSVSGIWFILTKPATAE